MSERQAKIQASLERVEREIEYSQRLLSAYNLSRQAYYAKLIELIGRQEVAARHDQSKCNADGIEL